MSRKTNPDGSPNASRMDIMQAIENMNAEKIAISYRSLHAHMGRELGSLTGILKDMEKEGLLRLPKQVRVITGKFAVTAVGRKWLKKRFEARN